MDRGRLQDPLSKDILGNLALDSFLSSQSTKTKTLEKSQNKMCLWPITHAEKPEEFVLDDREIFSFYEIDKPRQNRFRNPRNLRKSHLRTVSIIDTLSEMALDPDDAAFSPPCNSLKKTLKYLRMAVVAPGEAPSPTKRHNRKREEYSRHCMSDSEVKTISKAGNTTRLQFKSKMPEWIKSIFSIAKTGNLSELKKSLHEMDGSLIRNLSDEHGNNLWHICAAYNHLPCLSWLTKFKHPEVYLDENQNGFTPLTLAVKHGHIEVIRWIVQNISSASRDNILHTAAKYGQEIALAWIVNKQIVDVNKPDREGNTSLHLAAKYGHAPCIKHLILSGGADLSSVNHQGVRPYELALSNSHHGCCDLLIAMEMNLSLATDFLLLDHDAQNLNQEHSELKNIFRDLLFITKRILRQQHKLRTYISKECAPTDDKIFDFSDEGKLNVIEERWRTLRRQQGRFIEDKRTPLDLVKIQFSQVMARAKTVEQKPELKALSSSDSSLSEKSLVMEPLTTKNKSLSSGKVIALEEKNSPNISEEIVAANLNSSLHWDINLRLFFDKNPELRQEGKTCSVLEVLEPSGSDNEEHASSTSVKRNSRSTCKEEKWESGHSSSSSLHSTNEFPTPINKVKQSATVKTSSLKDTVKPDSSETVEKTKKTDINKISDSSQGFACQDKFESSLKGIQLKPAESLADGLCLLEPDLIRETHHAAIVNKEKAKSMDNILNSSLTEEDSSLLENIEAGGTLPSKKKGFLLKFSLKGRWPNKSKQSAIKKVISAEEFKETYSRSPINESSSQVVLASEESTTEDTKPNMIEELKDPPTNFFVPSLVTQKNTGECLAKVRIIPKEFIPPPLGIKKEPPPAPPVEDEETPSFPWSTSPKPESLSRPLSSASRYTSRFESTSYLNKSMCSDVLTNLESNGRHSPAPSEVSKTESALSPPSEMSKAESLLLKSSISLSKLDSNLPVEELSEKEMLYTESSTLLEEKKTCSLIKNSAKDKAWYEISDDDDILTPQRYQNPSHTEELAPIQAVN